MAEADGRAARHLDGPGGGLRKSHPASHQPASQARGEGVRLHGGRRLRGPRLASNDGGRGGGLRGGVGAGGDGQDEGPPVVHDAGADRLVIVDDGDDDSACVTTEFEDGARADGDVVGRTGAQRALQSVDDEGQEGDHGRGHERLQERAVRDSFIVEEGIAGPVVHVGGVLRLGHL